MAEGKLGVGAFNQSNAESFDIRIGGKLMGQIYLVGVDQPKWDRYREIRNGNPLKRLKGKPGAAREYLLEQCYPQTAPKTEMINLGFEGAGEQAGVQLDLDKYDDTKYPTQRLKEIQFWKDCGTVLDATLLAYANYFFPDVDHTKSGSGGEEDSEG